MNSLAGYVVLGIIFIGGAVFSFFYHRKKDSVFKDIAQENNFAYGIAEGKTIEDSFFFNETKKYKRVIVSGYYKNLPFKLCESNVGRQVFYNIIIKDSHKFFGVMLCRNTWANKPKVLGYNQAGERWKRVSLESNEFAKKFLVYSVTDRGAYYDLHPDHMAEILDVTNNDPISLIEAEKETIMGSMYSDINFTNKDEVRRNILGSLETMYKINNIFKK